MNRYYAAIDLKSFYASVECVERGLNPLKTNLVVADPERTEKTIGLAVSPSLKSFGVPSRPRLFEVVEAVKLANGKREGQSGYLVGESYDLDALTENQRLAIGYIVAPPRMAKYIEYSTRIYGIYLRYFAPEDIHVYSIDEVFIDLTPYLTTYKLSPRELTVKVIREVLRETGITATAGIGTNLYLSKVAMDIVAKKLPADKDGVRIAELNERSYREKLWSHRPLTDFWRIGRGYATKLESLGIYTMGDVAKCSVGKEREFYNEELLYRTFGVNAELLIDHAWGVESCTMADIKAYKPSSTSMSCGQVLQCPYSTTDAKIVVLEMAEQLSLDLRSKGLLCESISVSLGYDRESLRTDSKGVELATDYYGRTVPKGAHGSAKFKKCTASTVEFMRESGAIYDRIVNKDLLIRRININATGLIDEKEFKKYCDVEQLDIFSFENRATAEMETDTKERESKRQDAIIDIKNRFGKNSIVRAMDLLEGATAISRNEQIGGHKA